MAAVTETKCEGGMEEAELELHELGLDALGLDALGLGLDELGELDELRGPLSSGLQLPVVNRANAPA
ncbi:hypothetical protein BGZ75_009623, partial [Mortierella antarctica]